MDWFRLGISAIFMIILVAGIIGFGTIFFYLIKISPYFFIPICGVCWFILYDYVKPLKDK